VSGTLKVSSDPSSAVPNVTLEVARSRAGTSPRGRTDVSDPLELFLLPGRVTHRVTSSRPLEITSERPFER